MKNDQFFVGQRVVYESPRQHDTGTITNLVYGDNGRLAEVWAIWDSDGKEEYCTPYYLSAEDENSDVQEILDILQEECLEVGIEVSKIRRFGLGSCHPETMITNVDSLTKELGDLQCMIDLVVEHGIVSLVSIKDHAFSKRQKLKKFSKISVD